MAVNEVGRKKLDEVDETSLAYDAMLESWDLVDDLCGGTRAMRSAGRKWLPQESKESDGGYEARLGRSILFEGYADALENAATKPFSKPIEYEGVTPGSLEENLDNVDLRASTMQDFALDFFRALVKYGVSHILVDFPTVPSNLEGSPLTLVDERELGVRPYFVHVEPRRIKGWRHTRDAQGRPQLTQIRVHEWRTEPVGAFGEEHVQYIRVYEPQAWQLWRKGPKDEKFVMVNEGPNTLGRVPLVTVNVTEKATDSFVARPPLEKLAWMNVAHWQSYSDQRNILKVARFAMLFLKGLTEEEMDKEFTFGPRQLIRSTNPDADGKYLEHSGAAIASGQTDLEHIEAAMTLLGLEPFMERSGTQTATAKAIDTAGTHSSIQTWIGMAENGLRGACQLYQDWLKQPLPEDWKVKIFSDFLVTLRGQEDVAQLIKMRATSEIDHQTFLEEVKRRGMLSEMTSVEEIMKRVEAEKDEAMARALEMAQTVNDGQEEDDDLDRDPNDDEGNQAA